MSRKDWENGSLQNKLIKAIIRHLCICKQDFRTKIVRNDIGVLNCKETPLENYLYDSCAYDSELERNNITHSKKSSIASVEVYGKIPRRTVRIPTYAEISRQSMTEIIESVVKGEKLNGDLYE